MINKTLHPRTLGLCVGIIYSFIGQMFFEHFLCVHIILGAGDGVLMGASITINNNYIVCQILWERKYEIGEGSVAILRREVVENN